MSIPNLLMLGQPLLVRVNYHRSPLGVSYETLNLVGVCACVHVGIWCFETVVKWSPEGDCVGKHYM